MLWLLSLNYWLDWWRIFTLPSEIGNLAWSVWQLATTSFHLLFIFRKVVLGNYSLVMTHFSMFNTTCLFFLLGPQCSSSFFLRCEFHFCNKILDTFAYRMSAVAILASTHNCLALCRKYVVQFFVLRIAENMCFSYLFS